MTTPVRPIIVPTLNQVLLSGIFSLLLLAIIFHGQLTSLIAGASGITTGELQASYQHTLNAVNNVGFVPKLTIGLFWAGVGVVGYFFVLTLSNFVIALRNEVVVDTTYTNTGELVQRFRLPLWRLVLTSVLGVFLLLSLKALLPLWIELAGHIIVIGFGAGYLIELLIAIFGLAVNIYVGWMLALAIKNLDSIV